MVAMPADNGMAFTGMATLATLATHRIEIQSNGRYWQWRERGSRDLGKFRAVRYGGKTELLSPERMEEYVKNKTANRQRRKGN